MKGSQDELRAGTETESTHNTALLSMILSAGFLYTNQDNHSGLGIPNQSYIKNCFTVLPTGQSDEGIFLFQLRLGFLFQVTLACMKLIKKGKKPKTQALCSTQASYWDPMPQL